MTDPLDLIRKLFGPISEAKAFYKVDAISTEYPGQFSVWIPDHPGEKLFAGLEGTKKLHKLIKENKHDGEDSVERSLRRTKKEIKGYVLCNSFDWFVTFTFNCRTCPSNCRNDPCICLPAECHRFNEVICKSKIEVWLKNQKKRNGKFQYLIVSELHKNGAYHFHAVIKDYAGKIKPSIKKETGEQLIDKFKRKVFELPGYKSGFSRATQITANPKSYANTANYLNKYITKDMPRLSGKKRYWRTNDLKKPIVVYNPPKWYLDREPDWQRKSEFGLLLIFNKPPLDEVESST